MMALAPRPVALVTGCSSGLGLVTALELTRVGFRVFAGMRDVAKRQPLDRRAAEAGLAPEVIALDVTSETSIAEALQHIESQAGRVDLLVNNAGIAISGFVEETSLAELREQFETNFFGLVALTKAVLPAMRMRASGRIINISSTCAHLPMPALAAYSGSKAALDAFTAALRAEVRAEGIWVSLLRVGAFKTEIFAANRRYTERTKDPAAPHARLFARLERYSDAQLARNRRDPRDVARLVARVATTRRPGLVHRIGADALLQDVVLRVLPRRVVEWMIERVMARRR